MDPMGIFVASPLIDIFLRVRSWPVDRAPLDQDADNPSPTGGYGTQQKLRRGGRCVILNHYRSPILQQVI